MLHGRFHLQPHPLTLVAGSNDHPLNFRQDHLLGIFLEDALELRRQPIQQVEQVAEAPRVLWVGARVEVLQGRAVHVESANARRQMELIALEGLQVQVGEVAAEAQGGCGRTVP